MALGRGGRESRGEEGQVIPLLLTAIIAIVALTMLIMQVGRAGLLRTQSQTAADAAALAAMEAIRDDWRAGLAAGHLPFHDYEDYTDIAREAAADYASRNGGELTDFDFTGGFNQYVVTVRTRSAEKQGGDLEEVDDERAAATAHASMTAPDCDIQPAPQNAGSVPLAGLWCAGDLAASWAAVDNPGDLRDDVAPYWNEPTLERERPEITHLHPAVAFDGNLSHAMGAQISRGKMVERAKSWLEANGGGPVPYSMSGYFPGPGGKSYRTDCSGFISMAWSLEASLTTTTLQGVAHSIDQDELQPGDILLNSEGAGAQSHVVMFLGWVPGSGKSKYKAIEQRGGDGTVVTQEMPYPYFSEKYDPYRYDNIVDNPGSSEDA